MISAEEMVRITNKNKGGSHVIDPEASILAAAQKGLNSIEYIELNDGYKLELARAGYKLEEYVTKGKMTTKITWESKYI